MFEGRECNVDVLAMPVVPPPRALPRPRRSTPVTLADHRVFRVERSVFTQPGTPPHDVQGFTLACGDWCNVVAVTDTDEIVLVWQHRFGIDAPSLEIPGGLVDPGEAPLEAAVRELAEETGWEAEGARPLTSVHPNPALQGNRCFSFLARAARLGAQRTTPGEICEPVLVSVRDVARALDAGEIEHALAVVALETYLRRRAAGEMSITSASASSSASS